MIYEALHCREKGKRKGIVTGEEEMAGGKEKRGR